MPESAVVESVAAGWRSCEARRPGRGPAGLHARRWGGGFASGAARRGPRSARAGGQPHRPGARRAQPAGLAEIEFEVIRDAADTAIAICGMENLDPMGVHTGDSIVVAPIQTLPDVVVQRLRRSALGIARALKLEGGCNVQLAVSPDGSDYRVIEVNRVSRSSALASKATGYPIARSPPSLGKRLDEMRNPATGGGSAAFEPAVDYVVVKLPRWPFDKFPRRAGPRDPDEGHRKAMAIDREFGPALLKAVRSLEPRGAAGCGRTRPGGSGARTGRPRAFLAPSDTRL